MLAEYFANRRGFGWIVSGSPGSVRVDVAHLLGLDSRVANCGSNRTRGSIRAGLRDMMRIRRHPEAHDFGIDVRAAGMRRLQGLEHKHGPPFTENQAAPVFRERAASVR